MKRGILGIFDYDRCYISKLMEYLNRKQDFGFETRMFTSIERLIDFLEKSKMDILLIGDRVSLESIDRKKIRNIFVLSEGGLVAEENEYPVIYKFQSMEAIIREILGYCTENGDAMPSSVQVLNPGTTEFIGVVSPKGGSGKTIFSMALGEAFGQTGNILYLGFEMYGSSLGLEGDRAGMSDLIYYIKQRKRGISMIIHSIAEKIGSIDCITSVAHFGDLQALDHGDIDFLMEELRQETEYNKVIFDLGFLDSNAYYIMERCNSIYATYLNRDRNMSKKAAFSRVLRFEEKEFLNERLKEVELPHDRYIASGNYEVDSLLKGELGQHIWNLIGRA